MKSKNVQIIKKGNTPEWAVIPYKEYLHLQELAEITHDVAQFNKALQQGSEELIPDDYAKRLIQGENPIRVWREYRGLTQAVVAKQAGISTPYLSQIEHNERTASVAILKKLAKALNVSIDDIS